MKIDAIELAGWKAFVSPVRLALSTLPGVLTAISGANGAGKTTLCTLGVLGSQYRRVPDQSPNDLAASRAAYVQAEVELHGRKLTIRQTFDAKGGGSVLVTGEDGRPIDACMSGGIKEYQTWRAGALPDYDVTTASTYLGQGDGGLLMMTDTARARVILRAQGADAVTALAKGARDRARDVERDLAGCAQRIEDERGRHGGLVVDLVRGDRLRAAQADLAAARAGHAQALEAQAAAARLEALESAAGAADEVLAAARRRLVIARDRWRVELDRRRAVAGAARVRAAGAVAARADVEALLTGADVVRAAFARWSKGGQHLEEHRQRLVALEARREGHVAALSAIDTRYADFPDRRRRLQWQAGKLASEIAVLADVERDEADLARQRVAVEDVEGVLAAQDAFLARLRDDQRLVLARQRETLLTALQWLAEDDGHGDGDYLIARAVARRAVTDDADLEQGAGELPQRIAGATVARESAALAMAGARGEARRLEASAARLPVLVRARAELDAARAALARLDEETRAIVAERDAAEHAHATTRQAIDADRAVAAEIERDRAAVAPHAARHAELAAIEGRLATAGAAVTRAEEDLAAAQAELAAWEGQEGAATVAESGEVALAESVHAESVEALRCAPEARGLEEADRAVRWAAAGVETAVLACQRAEIDHEQALAGAARVDALGVQRVALERDLADWRELGADLGRDGLQSDLVDSAAPMLTALANDLLRAAGILRWTVRFTTETVDKDGETVPGYPLLVRDELTGEEREARTFSGGEKVLIGAAVANAVAVLACQRAGITGPVLIRDESGAALDAAGEAAWCAMLRRTIELTAASRVLVVTHSPTLRALCDSAVWVHAGAVEEHPVDWSPDDSASQVP